MNKRILLGAMTLGVAPIAITVSCSAEDGIIDPSTKAPEGKIDPSTKGTESKYHNHDVNKFMYDNLADKFNIKEDGLYILKQDYKNGELMENDKPTDKELLPLTTSSFMDGVMQLGEGDSIYMIYDNDDEDGLSEENFEETVFFADTSIMHSDSIDQINKNVGNKIVSYSTFGHTLISFNQGKLNTYFGSQSNHISGKEVSFEKKLEDLKEFYKDNQSVIEAIQKYYETASKVFYPVVFSSPLITYEKLNNAVKITFHNIDEASVTAANFVVKTNENYAEFGRLSIGGEQEWNSYNKPSYHFLAHKNSGVDLQANKSDEVVKKSNDNSRLSPLSRDVIARKHAEFLAKLEQWEKDLRSYSDSVAGSTPWFLLMNNSHYNASIDQWKQDHPKPTE